MCSLTLFRVSSVLFSGIVVPPNTPCTTWNVLPDGFRDARTELLQETAMDERNPLCSPADVHTIMP